MRGEAKISYCDKEKPNVRPKMRWRDITKKDVETLGSGSRIGRF